MKPLASALLILLVSFASPAAMANEPAGPRPIEGVEVTTPDGEYAVVTLTLTVPDGPERFRKWRYIGGMRDGRLPITHGRRLREPGGELQLKGDTLSGTFSRAEGRRGAPAIAEVTVDATVKDDQITGTVTVDGHKGQITGRITPAAAVAKSNAVPKDKGWPMYLGPVGGGVAAEPTGVEIVDSFHDARLVWGTEETDIGEGIGSITRYMHKWKDASRRGTTSGSTSPIAADGTIFLSYYVPSPARGMHEKHAEDMVKDAGVDSPEDLPVRAKEKIYKASDDVVLAMDAATGATRWKAVMSGRGVNHQHHKEGPFIMTPAYAEGRVFAIGMSGWLYAFDAESGKPLWEVRLTGAHGGKYWSASAVALPGVVVAPQGNTWAGFDPATGKRLWKSSLSFSHAALAVWRHKGTDYLLSGTGGNLVWGGQGEELICLNARTGEQVWESDLPGELSALNSRGRGLGPGGVTIHDDYLVAQIAQTDADAKGRGERRKALHKSIHGYRLTREGPKHLWQIPMTGREGSNTKPIVHGKYLFTGNLEVVDLKTGKVISQAKGVRPGNGGYMQAIEDVVFIRPDGTHGRIDFATYRISPEGKVTPMDPERGRWIPPVGGSTTSYKSPLTYPMIDGRIYMRQKNGVYCWDLRKRP